MTIRWYGGNAPRWATPAGVVRWSSSHCRPVRRIRHHPAHRANWRLHGTMGRPVRVPIYDSAEGGERRALLHPCPSRAARRDRQRVARAPRPASRHPRGGRLPGRAIPESDSRMASRPPATETAHRVAGDTSEQTETPGAEPSLGSFISDSVRRSSARFRGEESHRGLRAALPSRRRPRPAARALPGAAPRDVRGRPLRRAGRSRRERCPQASPPRRRPRPWRCPPGVDAGGDRSRRQSGAGNGLRRRRRARVDLLIWLLASTSAVARRHPHGDGRASWLPIGQQATPPSGPGRAIVTPTPPPSVANPAGSDNILDGCRPRRRLPPVTRDRILPIGLPPRVERTPVATGLLPAAPPLLRWGRLVLGRGQPRGSRRSPASSRPKWCASRPTPSICTW